MGIIEIFCEAEIGFISQMREVSCLLDGDELLHLGLLLDLFKIDRVVSLQALLVLSIFPLGRQVVNPLHHWLLDAVEHLLSLASGSTRRILLILLCLLFFHVLCAATRGIMGLLAILLVVCQRETGKQHHVSLVIGWGLGQSWMDLLYWCPESDQLASDSPRLQLEERANFIILIILLSKHVGPIFDY